MRIVKDEKTIGEYQVQLNKAFDIMVAEADQEYNQQEYVLSPALKPENKK